MRRRVQTEIIQARIRDVVIVGGVGIEMPLMRHEWISSRGLYGFGSYNGSKCLLRSSQDERRAASARRMAVFRDAERKNLWKKITETPDHVCSCCHRKFYRSGGTKPRASSRVVPFALELLQPYTPDLTARNLWLCTNCRSKLDEEDIPALSISNDLTLAPIPEAIQQLNYMERRLIAPVHTFQTIIALPSGRQQAAKGIAISFPYNVGEMIQTLPRPADDSGSSLWFVTLTEPNQSIKFRQTPRPSQLLQVLSLQMLHILALILLDQVRATIETRI